MARTVVGLFERVEEAEQAVKGLRQAGVPAEEISLVARNIMVEREVETTKTFDEVAKSTGAGAVGGGVIGGTLGTLVGIGALTIPGLGPAFAAGTLAATLGSAAAGAGVGAATGGIIGALLGLSIPDQEAHVYAEGLKRGGILVTVQTDEGRAHEVNAIMKSANALDVNALRRQWKGEGWSGYDEKTEPGKDYPSLRPK